jgi:hypothetical protein
VLPLVEITGTRKELEMHTNTQRPEPSSQHATCAWCALNFGTVVELIDHVDELHLADKPGFHLLEPWSPTPDEVPAVLDEMRPIITRLAARDQRQLAEWSCAG